MIWPLSLRLAARELRSGVAGFRILLACLALGVAAIAASGSTAEAFRQGLAAQAREILGGDLRIGVESRRFSPAEHKAFDALGKVAWSAATRAMAQSQNGQRRLVELRGVSETYPLVGKVTLEGAPSLTAAFVPLRLADGTIAYGAAVEPALFDRLGLTLGDVFLIGETKFVARARLMAEPDRLGRGFGLGPRVLTALPTLEQAGFLAATLPGTGEVARVRLSGGTPPAAVASALRKTFPDGALQIRDRNDAAAGIRQLINQLEYFLGFIGLASLVAGGLGVAGAVGAYLEARKPTIAVLKALGANNALVRNLYLAQLSLLAMLGIMIGLVIGAIAPLGLGVMAAKALPIPALFAIYPMPLIKAAAFGALAAAAFSLAPLARVRTTTPAALFRRDIAGRLKPGPELVAAGLAGVGLAILAVTTAPTPVAAAIMIAGVVTAFAALTGLGGLASWFAGRFRQGTRGWLRIGLANLAGPRSAARTATPAIGLGLALLAAVVLIQSSLLAQVSRVAPRTAPSIVFTDIPAKAVDQFDSVVAEAFGTQLTPDNYLRAPFATGRITQTHGRPVDRSQIKDSERWAYDNDIALSTIGAEPRFAGITEGHWWTPDYRGPPLLAMESDAARGGDLKIGDLVTIQILGRDIEARLAVLRKVEWGGFGAAFALILDPYALEGAPLNHVAIAKANRAQEARVLIALGHRFPLVNVISVREQLEAAGDMFQRLALAIRGAAGVAAVAGLLVLAGAIAAGARGRAKEAAILRVLGASSGQILAAYAVEYGAVGLIAGLAGVALGYLAAWPVVVKVFEATWSVDWSGIVVLISGAAGLAALGGLIAALMALRQRPAPVLRSD